VPPPPEPTAPEAKVLILERTMPMPRSSEALSSRTRVLTSSGLKCWEFFFFLGGVRKGNFFLSFLLSLSLDKRKKKEVSSSILSYP